MTFSESRQDNLGLFEILNEVFGERIDSIYYKSGNAQIKYKHFTQRSQLSAK
jgi:hypothetical protein